LIFCGPILGPIGGPRVKLKDRGFDLKTNKNKYTQVRLNILEFNMGHKYRVFQYGVFLTALAVMISRNNLLNKKNSNVGFSSEIN
jgi:hypothetical protein